MSVVLRVTYMEQASRCTVLRDVAVDTDGFGVVKDIIIFNSSWQMVRMLSSQEFCRTEKSAT